MSARVRPIGCIADDITGATDLASALAARGLDTRLAFGAGAVRATGGDAIVVALKIRSVPAADARAAAVEAANALRAVGARQLFSKYCSTFDSTADGNIGPIADALIDVTDARRVLHCPSYPANGRTVYLGHLFVGDELLSDSPMRDHPLNPMRDPQLRRVLAEQTARDVKLLRWPDVDAGPRAVASRLDALSSEVDGAHHVIVDAVVNADLETIAAAASDDALSAGSAAYGAAYVVAAHARAGHRPSAGVTRAVPPSGRTAILAGSLSRATREQVGAFGGPTLTLSIDDLVDGSAALRRALDFAGRGTIERPVLIATERDAAGGAGRGGLNSAEIARRIEAGMGQIGSALVDGGVRRLIVAGGETSGAVADALDLQSARIGPDISVGVPWIVSEDRSLAVAFKSGNFGGPTFFADALEAAGS